MPPAGVSARRPTYLLCWCKEGRPRKHLQCNTPGSSGADRSLTLGAAVTRCSRKGLLDSPRPFTDTGARPASRWTTSRRTCAGAAACRWLVVQRGQATVRLGGERSWTVEQSFARASSHHRLERSERYAPDEPGVLHSRCFLCFLSLHQQRKGVARRGETRLASTANQANE